MWMKVSKIIYGAIFVLSGILIAINTLFYSFYHRYLLNFLVPDLGYSVVLITIGIISLAFIRSSDIIKLSSSLLVSTIMSTMLFILRTLTIMSHWIDAYILTLEGEEYLFNLFEEMNYLEIYLAPLTIILLIYSYHVLRKYTI